MDNFEAHDDGEKVRIPINVSWVKEPVKDLDVRRLIMLLDRGSLVDHNNDRMYRCGDPACNLGHKGLKALLIHAIVAHGTPPTEPVTIKIPFPKNPEPPKKKSFFDKLRDFTENQGD